MDDYDAQKKLRESIVLVIPIIAYSIVRRVKFVLLPTYMRYREVDRDGCMPEVIRQRKTLQPMLFYAYETR